MLIPQKKQQGVGLIEVLTSMLVLSIGVLGMISVQSRSVQFNQGAMYESKAAVLANDIMDRIRANPDQASRYRITLGESASQGTDCFGAGANCTESNMADYDVASWRTEIAENLPSGLGEVIEMPGAGGTSIFIVTIQYQDSRAEDGSAFSVNSGDETPPKQLSFRTTIR